MINCCTVVNEQNLRTQIDSIEDKDLLLDIFTAIQTFIEVENARMYPKFKQPNIGTVHKHKTHMYSTQNPNCVYYNLSFI